MCSWSILYFNWSRMGNYILIINYHICLETDTDFHILMQNLSNGVLLFTSIARSCLTGGLIQELEEHIGSGQGFQQPQCRNPNLIKCGGEAQHLEKWGFGVLRDSRMFRAQQQGGKTPCIGVFLRSLERS
jgi:hypothetical protein